MTRLTPEGWAATVRERLRTVRKHRNLTFEAIKPRRTRYAAVRLEIQGGNLLLDSVLRVCFAYQIRPDYILEGWPGWVLTGESAPPPVANDAEMASARFVAATLKDVRTRLKAHRARLGVGAPTVAMAVWGSRKSHSSLLRLEGGTTRRPDTVELYRLCLYYDLTFADLLGFTPEVPCPTSPPPASSQSPS